MIWNDKISVKEPILVKVLLPADTDIQTFTVSQSKALGVRIINRCHRILTRINPS